jgi:hypothetical protein
MNVATPNNFDILRGREHDEFARYVARPTGTILAAACRIVRFSE